MKHFKRPLITLICICLGVAALIKVTRLRASANDSKSQAGGSVDLGAAFQPHTTPGVGTATPEKLCSAVHPLTFNWRDTVIVPDDWSSETCKTFAKSLGLSQYQLGCANSNSFSWGDRNGSSPADDQCHW